MLRPNKTLEFDICVSVTAELLGDQTSCEELRFRI